MALAINVLSREITSVSFNLSVQFVLNGAHQNGLLVQKVERSDKTLLAFRNIQTDLATYWEAWQIINYQVHGVDVSNGQALPLPNAMAHDVFAGPAAGVGGTRIIGTLYWVTGADVATVLGRMTPGGVQAAASLYSTFTNPFNGLAPAQLLIRDEYFHYEVF